MNRRILAFAAVMTAAFCPWKATVAQRVSELRVAINSSRTRLLGLRDERGVQIDTQLANSKKPSLLRHVVYGAGAGLVLWGAYYLTTCDAGCRAEGSRGERFVLLPVAVGTGASVGFVVGLLRGAQ
jgi:hypothetical protein